VTEPLSLLVIDDEPGTRLSIRRFFEDAGFVVAEAPDGRSGLEIFRQRSPSAVLVDLHMPGVSGIEVIRAIAAESPGCPLIALSAAAAIQDAIHAVREGAWDYVAKPVADMAEIEIALQRGIERARLLRSERRHREELEQAVAQRTRELTEATGRLAASEARLRLLFENVSDIITVLSPDGVIVFETPSIERLLGYAPQERNGANVFDYLHPDDVGLAREAFADVIAGAVRRIEVRLRRKDGAWRTFEAIGRNSACGPGPQDVIVISRDVSERVAAERALRRSERIHREAIRAASGVPYYRDTQRGAYTFFGAESERLIGIPADRFTFHVGVPGVQEKVTLQSAVAPGGAPQPYAADSRVLTPSGEERWIADRAAPDIPEGATQPVGWMGILMDITALRRAQDESRLLAQVIRQASESVLITGLDGAILYVNPAFEEITGYSRTEVIGQNPRILKSGKHGRAFYQEMWNAITSGRVWKGRITNRRKDGSLYQDAATVCPIRDHKGHITSYVSVRREITHEVELESHLRRAQKMEAIALLAGGIAHDFNNVLTAIISHAELAVSVLPKSSHAATDLHAILTASNRASDLVKRILAFTRQREQERHPVRVESIVRETTKLLRASLPATIEVICRSTAASGLVLADPTQIHQIIMNLCANAAHAMRGRGGVLTVSLSEIPAGAPLPSRGPAPAPFLELAVQDTGHGIPPGIIDRIFEPYFTTKERQGGTGLGLSVVHGIVESHDGFITVDSEPGRGATFRVFLPLAALPEAPAAAPSPSAVTGNGAILFVDDEPAIASVQQRILSSLGYEVASATCGPEALALFQRDPKRFDLVITDMTMPRMTGADLIRELRALRPDLPVILCTGYSEDMTPEKAKAVGASAFVPKPLVRNELARIIHGILAGPRGNEPANNP